MSALPFYRKHCQFGLQVQCQETIAEYWDTELECSGKAMIFETVQIEGIAELLYLISDDDAGVAAVIDPRLDVDVYLKLSKTESFHQAYL